MTTVYVYGVVVGRVDDAGVFKFNQCVGAIDDARDQETAEERARTAAQREFPEHTILMITISAYVAGYGPVGRYP